MTGSVPSDRHAFSRAARQAFCNALLELPGMQTQDRRDHVFGQLTPDFPGLRSVRRSDEAHVDLIEIVSAANDYPGALRAILEIVSYLHDGEPALQRIKTIVEVADPANLLTANERQDLLIHLRSADPPVAASAFHYSTGATIHDAGLDVLDIARLLAWVENRPTPASRLPALFEFIDHIAHRVPQAQRAPLHIAMDRLSVRLGYGRGAVDTLCQATDNRRASNGRYYLVAELRPDRLRADHYFLAAWRQHDGEPEEALYQSDLSVHWDEAITTTHQLMRELAINVDGAAQERVLELIVPRSLVTHDIDQWPVDEVLPAAIGTNYPLVLRSFDRLDDPSMHVDWARNWRWVKQNDRTAGGDAVREVASHLPDVVQALRAALLRDGPPAIVVMLAALPQSQTLGIDAYTAGLRGGAPIMVWSRDDDAGAELARSVRAACRDGLLSLREHVFQLRLSALEEASGDTAVSLRATIVFDDHDRIPERFRGRARLRSPHTEEA